MASEKACYWVALGVFALVVSNHFLTRHDGVIGSLSRQSLAVAERVSDHATHFTAMAGLMLDRNSTGLARAQANVACAQARLASVQTVLARNQAAFARLETQRARVIVLEPARHTVVCPRQVLRPIPAL